MKKIITLVLALLMLLSLAACGEKTPATNDENTTPSNQQTEDPGQQEQTQTEDPGQQEQTQPAGDAVSSTDWPTNTIFPKPEGCKIVEVKSEGGKNYITVEWDSLDAAKAYIEIAKQTEGEGAEVIAGYNDDATAVYGTYAITITSENEAQNLVLYK